MKGLTLLELLLSVAIITILAGFSIPVYSSLQVKNDLDLAAASAAQSLRRAQVLSQAIDGDISWGVKIQNSSLIIFKGNSFVSRDSNFDENFDLSSINASGITEIVFNKFSATPQTTGNIILTSGDGSTKTLNINSKGMVDY